MVTSDVKFTGSIPEIYDRYFVPLIFEDYARDLADRTAAARPKDVLETAAGTGVVTRALALRLPADARIVASDLNQPMLDYAQKRQGDGGRVTWRQADALALPFPEESFDAVMCQFGVMFFPDRVVGYREARRVLKPSGRFLFSAWDRISENEFAAVVAEALAEMFPGDPPRFMERTPHGYFEEARIRADLAAAGFGHVVIDTVSRTSRARSAHDAAIAYCEGTPWRGEIEARDPTSLARATERAARALERRFGTGPIEGRIRALIVTAMP